HIERGRSTDKNLIVRLIARVDDALYQFDGDSTEANILRDLIFNRNINDRDQTELDLNAIRRSLDVDDSQLRRALRVLAARGIISIRNAYQGRGIRLLDNPPAATLRLDTKALAARAAAEQWERRTRLDDRHPRACLPRPL